MLSYSELKENLRHFTKKCKVTMKACVFMLQETKEFLINKYKAAKVKAKHDWRTKNASNYY